jgi:hypothetical protein
MLTRAYEAGILETLIYLEGCYLFRSLCGVDPNEEKANFWLQERAKHGDRNAKRLLEDIE